MKKTLSFLLILSLCLMILFGCSTPDSEMTKPKAGGEDTADATPTPAAAGPLKVHFIYVGQGDASFIEFPDGQTMLIDAGPAEQGAKVVDYISSLGYTKIDYVVGTHPHTDHIGGLLDVLRSFDIGSVYMPDAPSEVKTYADLMQLIQENGLTLVTAAKDVEIKPGFAVILAPEQISKDMNDNSAVVRVTYGNTNFLFMGDASKNVEGQLAGDIKADVLKVGNHGSSYASSPEFIARVSPKIAVIPCGKNNQYKLPNGITIKTLRDAGAKIYETSLNGNVTVTSDGTNVTADSEALPDEELDKQEKNIK